MSVERNSVACAAMQTVASRPASKRGIGFIGCLLSEVRAVCEGSGGAASAAPVGNGWSQAMAVRGFTRRAHAHVSTALEDDLRVVEFERRLLRLQRGTERLRAVLRPEAP